MNVNFNEFDSVMEEIGFGRVHLYAMLTNGLLQMMTIHETMGMAIVGPAAVCDLRMNLIQQSTIKSATFMGIICSSYFWGYITDKMGRRWILLRTISLSNICSILSMFMVTFTGCFIMRFITGVFVAGPSFVAVTYLSEFCNKHILSRVVTYMYMFTGFAMLYSPSVATFILGKDILTIELNIAEIIFVRPWRLFGCTLMLPGLIAFFLLLQMPESPKFLFMIGDTKQGLAAMDWVSVKNTGHPLTPAQVAQMVKYQAYAQVKRKRRSSNVLQSMLNDAMPLFRKPFVGYYLSSCAVMFSLGLVANGLGLWFTGMRNRCNMREGPAERLSLCEMLFGKCDLNHSEDYEEELEEVCNDAIKSFNDSIALGLTYITLYKVCWALLFFIPRKMLFVLALLMSSSCGFGLIILTNPTLQLYSFIFFLAFPGVVISLMGGALLEFVPTHMRAKALCICLMWCRWGAVVGNTIIGVYVEVNCELTIMQLAMFPLLSASIEGFLPL